MFFKKLKVGLKSQTTFFLIVIFIIIIGCNEEHKGALYRVSEKDSLNYLVSNSDVIALIKINQGLPDDYGGITKKPSVKFAKAKCSEVYKGTLKKKSTITISSSTVYNKPGSIATYMSLRNGNYIAFLVKSNELFKPLTPYSLIEIQFDQGRPIWKQTKSKYVDRPEMYKDKIIKEIQNAIVMMKRNSD